jgi:hypothetical protein
MKTRRFTFLVLCVGFTAICLLMLTSFFKAQAGGLQSLSPFPIVKENHSDPILPKAPTPALGAIFVVNPDPPLAHEPTELRVILDNPGASEIVRYAQFSWSELGLGMERHLIAGRLSFISPPHGQGSAQMVWVPPNEGRYGFYVDIFDAPGAPDPILSLQHNVVFLAHPDPTGPVTMRVVDIPLRNPLPATTVFTLSLPVPPEAVSWQAEARPLMVNMLPGQTILAQAVFTYTGGGQMPPAGVQVFKLESFTQGNPAGAVEISFGPPVKLHLGAEPPFAESEISVDPYPVRPGEPTQLCALVRNVTQEPRSATLFFRVAPFGIAMPTSPVAPPVPVFIPSMGIQRACIQWVSPLGGQFAVQVAVETPGYPVPQVSQRVVDVSEPLPPGATSSLQFPLRNPFERPVTITLVLRTFVNWNIDLAPLVFPDMGVNEVRLAALTVHVPPSASQLQDGQPLLDVEAFVGPESIGGLRKVYRPPVPVHHPADPIYAESEITIRPYPPRAGEPTEICVDLRNPTTEDQAMTVDFSWSAFGIGLPWHPFHQSTITITAGSMATPCTWWVPPFAGTFGAEAGVQVGGHQRVYSQRMIDVGEVLLPNAPTTFEFPVGNPFTHSVTVTLATIRHLPQWEVSFDKPVFTLAPGGARVVTMQINPVQYPGDPEPHEGDPVIDVEAYTGGELLGGFRKLFFPPVPIHRPQDPPYAEAEINITPYPPREREPTELAFEARNPTTLTQQISVTFEVSNLGIGLPYHAIARPIPLTLPPAGFKVVAVTWVPPFGGEFCVRVKVEAPGFGEPFYSARNISIVRLPQPYGLPEVFIFPVGDGGIVTRPLTVSLGLRQYLPGWQVKLRVGQIVFAPGQSIATEVMTITPPTDPAALPVDGGPVADVSGYVDGELIGGIRKVWRPPVPLGQLGEPSYAESEITINPDPPRAGVPTVFTAKLRNLTGFTQTIQVEFGWADFGFGIAFTNTNVVPKQALVHLAPYQVLPVSAQSTPASSGHYCVQIRLTNLEIQERLLSQRNVDVDRAPRTGCVPIHKEFPLKNTTSHPVTVTIGSSAVNLPVGWSYTVNPSSVVLQPGQVITVTLVITPPCSLNAGGVALPGMPDALNPPVFARVQVEGYDQTGTLVGGVEEQLVIGLPYRFRLPIIRRSP